MIPAFAMLARQDSVESSHAARRCPGQRLAPRDPQKNKAALERNAACLLQPGILTTSSERGAKLAVRHFLRHVQDELAVRLLDLAQQTPEFVEKACVFSDAAPRDVVGRLPLG